MKLERILQVIAVIFLLGVVIGCSQQLKKRWDIVNTPKPTATFIYQPSESPRVPYEGSRTSEVLRPFHPVAPVPEGLPETPLTERLKLAGVENPIPIGATIVFKEMSGMVITWDQPRAGGYIPRRFSVDGIEAFFITHKRDTGTMASEYLTPWDGLEARVMGWEDLSKDATLDTLKLEEVRRWTEAEQGVLRAASLLQEELSPRNLAIIRAEGDSLPIRITAGGKALTRGPWGDTYEVPADGIDVTAVYFRNGKLIHRTHYVYPGTVLTFNSGWWYEVRRDEDPKTSQVWVNSLAPEEFEALACNMRPEWQPSWMDVYLPPPSQRSTCLHYSEDTTREAQLARYGFEKVLGYEEAEHLDVYRARSGWGSQLDWLVTRWVPADTISAEFDFGSFNYSIWAEEEFDGTWSANIVEVGKSGGVGMPAWLNMSDTILILPKGRTYLEVVPGTLYRLRRTCWNPETPACQSLPYSTPFLIERAELIRGIGRIGG